MSWIRVGFIAILIANICGCAPSLKEWVKERGFEYDENYSTLNKLGNRVDGKNIEPNPYLAVDAERGNLPKIEDEKSRTFKIDGKADATNFAEGVASGALKGDFSKVSKLTVVMDKPYTERVTAWAPKGPCLEHTAISEVVNTGDMSLRLEDKTGGNVTGSFALEGNPANVEISVGAGSERLLKVSGKDFYIGYKTINRLCSSVSKKDIVLQKGKPTTDKQLGIDAIFLDHRVDEDGVPEVLVYFAPIPLVHSDLKNILPSLSSIAAVSQIVSPIETLTATISANTNVTSKAWEKAATASPDKTNSFVPGREGIVLKAKFGTGIGLSIGTDGLYLRVGAVDSGELTISGERIALSK